MEKKNRICAYKGDPVVPGVNKKKNGINFAVEVPGDTEASLVLYRRGAAEPETEFPFTEEYRTGRMCARNLVRRYRKMNMRFAVHFFQKKNMTGRGTPHRRFRTVK